MRFARRLLFSHARMLHGILCSPGFRGTFRRALYLGFARLYNHGAMISFWDEMLGRHVPGDFFRGDWPGSF
jgi:hypothetical protein